MSSAVQMDLLRSLVTECLSAAAEEILRLVHRTLLPDGQPCTKWVVDSQQLDAVHGEPEPVGPQSSVEDLKVCWELHVEDRFAVSTDTHPEEHELKSLSKSHRTTESSPAHTDCGADRSGEPRSPGTLACESPRPLCLFRVQPVSPERRHLTLKKSKPAHCAGSNQPSSHSQNLSKKISHLRAGTELKPYKCPCCPRAFSLTKTLIRHMKVHAESYQCSMCGKCFCQKSHLVSHTRVHTGERPFHCQLCPETFSHKRSMEKHMNKCHLVGL